MLQRISILERQSGCPLYDRIWDWKADQHEPDCTSTLNLFFRQLGLTINDQGDLYINIYIYIIYILAYIV